MKISDVMTIDPVVVSAGASVFEAMRLMLERRVSGLPVTDAHGKLVGIVSEGDFLRRGELGTEKRRPRWIELLTSPGRLADEYTGAANQHANGHANADKHAERKLQLE